MKELKHSVIESVNERKMNLLGNRKERDTCRRDLIRNDGLMRQRNIPEAIQATELVLRLSQFRKNLAICLIRNACLNVDFRGA